MGGRRHNDFLRVHSNSTATVSSFPFRVLMRSALAPAALAPEFSTRRSSGVRLAMQDQPGRFPPPWDIEEYDRSCYIVRENNGQALAYCYYEQKPDRRAAARLLTRDEARRIFAKRTCSGRTYLSLWHRIENGIDRLSHGGRCII